MVLLEDQDRGRWDSTAISEGFRCLERSAVGERMTRFHLESAIAARHCSAPSIQDTDWGAILELYDDLVTLTDSPIHRLNQAVAIGQVRGPERGLEAVRGLGDESRYASYLWYHAVKADLNLRLGSWQAAAEGFETALGLTDSPAERALIIRKLTLCRNHEEEKHG